MHRRLIAADKSGSPALRCGAGWGGLVRLKPHRSLRRPISCQSSIPRVRRFRASVVLQLGTRQYPILRTYLGRNSPEEPKSLWDFGSIVPGRGPKLRLRVFNGCESPCRQALAFAFFAVIVHFSSPPYVPWYV